MERSWLSYVNWKCLLGRSIFIANRIALTEQLANTPIHAPENQGRFPVPTLSIVIPVPDTAGQLEDTLLSVLENRPDDVEILVVHCGNYADPYDLTDEVRYVELPQQSTLANCVEAGVDASRGTIIHLLASGMHVEKDWVTHALRGLEDPDCGAASPVIVDQNGRAVARGVRFGLAGTRQLECSERWSTIDGPLLEAAFYRRNVLLDLLDLSQSSAVVGSQLLDVNVAMSLKAIGYRTVTVPECRILGPVPVPAKETGFHRGLHAQRLFVRHAASVGLAKTMFLHPMACGWQIVLDTVRGGALTSLLGRLVGLLSIGDARRYQIALAELRSLKLDTEVESTINTIRFDAARPPVQAFPDEAYPRARAG